MEDMLEKSVLVRELVYTAMGQNIRQVTEVTYRGVLSRIESHMIYVTKCQMVKGAFGFAEPSKKGRWFNTMAMTFLSVEEG